MDASTHDDLEMFCEEILDDPEEWLHSTQLISLIGEAAVQQLMEDARLALAITGGYISPPDAEGTGGTVRLLMERILRDPVRAERLAEAYSTMEGDAVERDMKDIEEIGDES
jgi:hypothetical protein